MKILKRIQLTNWHYFRFEVLDFGKINFLTGKNASGKTTIIDAIQLIFLGNTTGNFFNKSASDKSSRTLNGYLRCEIGDEENGEVRYLRKGRFSSYLAAEIYDDIEDTYFTIGCVFDCFDDTSYNSKYFSYNNKFSTSNFIVNKIPVEIKDLRAHIFEEFGDVDFSFFETNTSYRDFIREKFGGIGATFFSLFKKSIPFAPITNIESFITDYVCDIKSNIDISAMQENIRNYTQLELDAKNLQKRVDGLALLCENYDALDRQRNDLALRRYTKYRAEKAMKAKYLDSLNSKLDDINTDLNDHALMLTQCRAKIKELEIKKEQLISQRAVSDDFQQKALLTQQLDSLKQKITQIQERIDFISQSLLNYKNKWLTTLNFISDNLKSLNNQRINESLIEVKTAFNIFDPNKQLANINEKTLKELQSSIYAFKDLIGENYREYRLQAIDLKNSIQDLHSEIGSLQTGKKSYDSRLMKLQELIKDGLSIRYNTNVDVHILADLLEVKHEVWRKPIETYLGPQRFYLFVEPQYVDEAIAIYDQNKVEYGLNDYGIVDTDKIAKLNPRIERRALSEEITCNHTTARIYIDNLLGTLIKCDDVKNLRSNNRSITSSGMIYQNYVARQLNMDRTIPFLGANAAGSVVKTKVDEVKELEKQLTITYNLVANFEQANSLEVISTNEINNIANTVESFKEIDNYNKEYDDTNFKLNNIGKSNYYDHINKSFEEVELQLTDLRVEEQTIVEVIAKYNNDLERLKTNDIPTAKTSLQETINVMEKEFKDNSLIDQGEASFLSELAIYKTANNIYTNYSSQLELVENQIANLTSKVIAARLAYVGEYKLDYDTNDVTTNTVYSEELIHLRDNRLADYRQKIIVAKENAMKQFKDDFLAKLRSNIDTVKKQVDNLNFALANSKFGSDSYCFTISPNREYRDFYEMINDPLLITGHDIFSEEFNEKYGLVIEELFSKVTFIDEFSKDVKSDMEENIALFTDYRTYLKFDLEVTDQNGNVQRLSKTLLKKSGGETQTPFYISILASFAQLYRIIEDQNRSNTIRLIVFDEAFSKMDSERIQESVKLLRNYSLQAIISAPPEKMPDIVPLVDETLCVIRNNTSSRVTNYKKAEKVTV